MGGAQVTLRDAVTFGMVRGRGEVLDPKKVDGGSKGTLELLTIVRTKAAGDAEHADQVGFEDFRDGSRGTIV